MLTPAITFEVRDFTSNLSTQYVVLDTVENQEMVFGNRFTRDIHFAEMFDFQFEKVHREPKFIQFGNAVFDALYTCLDLDEDGVDYGDVMA